MGDLPPARDHRPSDAEVLALVRELGAGEAPLLARLHAAFDPALVRYLGATTRTDGAALAARTWLVASRRILEFPESGVEFRCWLLAIAHEQVARGDRRSWRQRSAVDRRTDDSDFSATTVAGQAAVRRITDALPPDQADVLLGAIVFGCTVDGIAHATGRSPRVVQALHDEARRTLQQAFGSVEGSRLSARAGLTTPTRPPPDLVAAMARAARSSRDRGGIRPTSATAAKMAVIALVVLGTTTSAAAATGTLPDAAQHRMAGIAARVGIELPDPSDRPAPVPPVDRATDPSTEETPSPDGPRIESHGSDVSDVARDPRLEGVDKGHQVADTARGDHGQDPVARPDRPETPSPSPSPAPAPEPAPAPARSAPPGPEGVDRPADRGQAPPPADAGTARSTRP